MISELREGDILWARNWGVGYLVKDIVEQSKRINGYQRWSVNLRKFNIKEDIDEQRKGIFGYEDLSYSVLEDSSGVYVLCNIEDFLGPLWKLVLEYV